MPKQKYKQRKDGRYTASITIGKLPNGNPKRKYVYANSPTELDKKITELKNNYYKGTICDDDITFEMWARRWFEVTMTNKEYATKREALYLLENHIFPSFGYMQIKDIKQFHIKALIMNLQQKGLTTTINKVIQLVKRIFNDAIENDIVYKNPATNIKKVKFEKNEKKPLTSYEDFLLLQTAKEHKYGAFIMTMRYAGLRREEIVALTKDDIDFDNKIINVNKAVSFQHNQPVKKSTKNKKSRKVDLPDILLPFLQKQVENCNNYLFPKQTDINQRASETAVRRWLESFLYSYNKMYEKYEKEKNPDFELTEDNKLYFTFHQLRHSYCTMLYYAGIKIKKAQELMGHSSADMVYDIYTHLDEEKENSKELINNYISSLL